jgi:hypothetical protein
MKMAMKKTSILTSVIFTAVLTAGLQAYAITQTSTTNYLGNPGPPVEGSPYQGTISFSSLVGGGSSYNGQLLTGGTLWVEIANDPPHDHLVYAWVGPYTLTYTAAGIAGQYTTTSSGDWLGFPLDAAEESYIEGQNSTHPIDFQVEADCDLDAYYLTLTNSVPDGGSTMVLLGGVLTALCMIKRKMA